jgi:hypothetical protein
MGYKSKIEIKGLEKLLGTVPDSEIAEKADLNVESVRTFRIRRRIPARWTGETEVGSTCIRPLDKMPTKSVKSKANPRAYGSIVTTEDVNGRTTDNSAANVVRVHTPSQVARGDGNRTSLHICMADGTEVKLRGKVVHTLHRVLSAHYGRPLPKNGTED